MKKRYWVILLFILSALIFFATILLTPLKFYNPILGGSPGWSKSISESQNRQVFVDQYYPNTNPVILNDTLKLTVSEAWLERMWVYEDYSNQSFALSDYFQFLVKLDTPYYSGFGDTWYFSSNDSTIGAIGYYKGFVIGKRIQQGTNLNKIGLFVIEVDTPSNSNRLGKIDTLGLVYFTKNQ